MLKILACVLLSCSALLPLGPNIQRLHIETNRQVETQSAIRYTFLSQRWLSREELERFKDVHGLTLAVKMRFSNESKNRIYFLAGSTGSVVPEGYRSFRKAGETKWQYLPKSRGREGPPGSEFTGVGFTWLELPSGAAIEFESYDWSREGEEHAFSTIVRKDRDSSPFEITSETYRPLWKGTSSQ